MAKVFDTWTVVPHKPIEKLEPNVWRVEGELPGRPSARRVMTVVKLASGGLLVHNGIALEEELMQELEAFGKPEVLIVPNGFHRLDAKIYKQRYPQLRVLCPAGARKKVAQVVAVDGTYDDFPRDDTVRMYHLDGAKQSEGVVEIKSPSGTTFVLNDAVFNLPKVGGVVGFMLGPTGRPAVPRVFRWFFVKDRAAFSAAIEQMAATPDFKRVIISHGKVLERADDLRTALTAF